MSHPERLRGPLVGACRLDELAKQAKFVGAKAMAAMDHGVMFGAVARAISGRLHSPHIAKALEEDHGNAESS